MAVKKIAALLKEARAKSGLSQAKLSELSGVSAGDIGKAERGEKELSAADLKSLAKPLGVTQKSLLEAAGYVTAADKKESAKTSAKTSSAGKTSSSAKTAAKTSTAKTDKKTAAKTEEEFKLTATEKKLVELYRAADSETKKSAMSLLKGETPASNGLVDTLTNLASSFLK